MQHASAADLLEGVAGEYLEAVYVQHAHIHHAFLALVPATSQCPTKDWVSAESRLLAINILSTTAVDILCLQHIEPSSYLFFGGSPGIGLLSINARKPHLSHSMHASCLSRIPCTYLICLTLAKDT